MLRSRESLLSVNVNALVPTESMQLFPHGSAGGETVSTYSNTGLSLLVCGFGKDHCRVILYKLVPGICTNESR